MAKIVKQYQISGKRDDLGNITEGRFLLGLDISGNKFLKHLEGCDTTMTCTERDIKTKKVSFVCSECGVRKTIFK